METYVLKKNKSLLPTQIIALGFLSLIILGGALLSLPISSATGKRVDLLDALFMSTSAVCVTGLTTIDSLTFSMFGQIVLLLLIQMGGLGFMTITTFVFLLLGKRINFRERIIIKESLSENSMSGLVKTTQKIFLFVFCIETIGAIILALCFSKDFPLGQSIYYGVFHSISAFCNAGFDVLPTDSFTAYVNNIPVNMTIMALIVLGGIGFLVVFDILKKLKKGYDHKLNLNTKVVVAFTMLLILAGALFFFLMEYHNPKTLGKFSLGDKMLASLFQSITPRTAGFNTISQAGMTMPSKIFTIILMIIGASPAGTGGGLKTTVVFLTLAMVANYITGKNEVSVFKRRVEHSLAQRATVISILGTLFIIAATLGLSISEHAAASLDMILFEVASAFGTVGLSMGLTPVLSVAGKIIIIITMYGGRIGFMTLAMAIARTHSVEKENSIRYPEDKLLIG